MPIHISDAARSLQADAAREHQDLDQPDAERLITQLLLAEIAVRLALLAELIEADRRQ